MRAILRTKPAECLFELKPEQEKDSLPCAEFGHHDADKPATWIQNGGKFFEQRSQGVRINTIDPSEVREDQVKFLVEKRLVERIQVKEMRADLVLHRVLLRLFFGELKHLLRDVGGHKVKTAFAEQHRVFSCAAIQLKHFEAFKLR